jgi:4-amino-4-deoxy-L-arabinose transferase-like glycosyltransferase
MRAHDFLERTGFGAAPPDDRFARRILLVACLLYALGFVAFYPNAVTNDDESGYMRQTLLLLDGASSLPKLNALDGDTIEFYPSKYPYGTALTMAAPVALVGWRGGYVVPCLSLLAGVLLLGRWLQQEGRSPLFALLLLGYPPNLVMGRVAMSDVPSLFLVILGLWLFWRGSGRSWRWWLGSGFVAGGSMLFRESNPIPFAPFFAGALLRRERNVWALVVGGLAGLGLRIAANSYFMHNPFHYRSSYILALATLPERLPIYALALLVFVPGGFVLALLYRGRRWPELCIAVAGFVTAYLIQLYYTFTTSLIKNMVVTPRYVIPIIPVIIFGMAESLPRLWRRCLEGVPRARRERFQAIAGGVVAVWIAAVGLASFAVHPAFWLWSAKQGEIRDAIAAETDFDAPVLTNFMATRKFLPELDMKYLPIDRAAIDVEKANSLVSRHDEIYIVFLDRSDSEHWRGDARVNGEFIRQMNPAPVLIYDRQITSTDHLRIWRARRDRDAAG